MNKNDKKTIKILSISLALTLTILAVVLVIGWNFVGNAHDIIRDYEQNCVCEENN